LLLGKSVEIKFIVKQIGNLPPLMLGLNWSGSIRHLVLDKPLVTLASAVAAVIALIRPASLSGSSHVVPGEIFYVRMYAARSIPFGLAAGILPFWPGGPAVAWILFTAAVIQIVDVVIAVGKKERGMILGASVGAIVHLLCGIVIM